MAPSSSNADTLALPDGLTGEEAARRLRAEGPNELPSAKPRTLLHEVLELLREPMLLLLVATGAVYLALGDLVEALAILIAIGVVVGLTLYQERKTERTLAALRNLSSPRARVVRDRAVAQIAGREVVRGDVLLVEEGGRVAADAALVSATNLSVDESLLTGESMPVPKRTGSSEGDLTLHAGTLVVSGHGAATVVATGAATELGRIGRALGELGVERTALQSEISRVVRILAAVGMSACLVVTIAYGLTRGGWLDGVLAGLTMAISMVPEEFPVILTVFMALGAWRISKNHVLTRRIPAIEMLGSATVLCADKTGTLTLNRMAVAAVWADGQTRTLGDGEALDDPFRTVIRFAVLSSRADGFDPMERAFLDLGGRLALAAEQANWSLIREFPLSEQLPAVAHVWRSGSGGTVAAMKGAPEAVVKLCQLDGAKAADIMSQVDRMAAGGLRVLGVAGSDTMPEQLQDVRWNFLGLTGLADPIRPGVADAVAECRTAGIRVVMITGDYPATALNIARQIGFPADSKCLTGAELAQLTEEDLNLRAQDVNVFARMVPQQKLRLVQALKARGEIVAMTGDGVNDAPALKAAHIGIAMGGRGSDVAREAGALVLLDDNFTSIVGAIRLGRRTYDNMRKAMTYALSIHVPIAGLSALPVLMGGPLILLPLHIIFMELIIDPACSVAFEMEPGELDLMRRPPRPPGQAMFTRGLIGRSLLQGFGVLVIAAAVFGLAARASLDESEVRLLTFTSLIVGNLTLIFTNRSEDFILRRRGPMNAALRWVAVSALAMLGIVLFVPPLRGVFRVAPPDSRYMIYSIVAALLMIVWVEIVKAGGRLGGRAARGRSVEGQDK